MTTWTDHERHLIYLSLAWNTLTAPAAADELMPRKIERMPPRG